MSTNLQLYKNLRVYRHLSFYGIVNHIVCNRLMKSEALVRAAPDLYRFARWLPGRTITHWILGNTFNRVFTGGDSLEGVSMGTHHLAERGIPIIIDFCAEGARNQLDSEGFLDGNARQFRQAAEAASRIPDQLISIKVTALVNMDLLEKYNRAVSLRDHIWQQYSSNGKLTAQGLFNAIQKIYPGLTTDDLAHYLRTIHSFDGAQPETFEIDEITFKMNHHSYYVYEHQKNEGVVMNVLFPLDGAEKVQMGNLRRRLDEVLNKQFDNPNDLKVLVDAEQSFVQRAIEDVVEQLQAKYNQEKAYIINTLQNYLKIAQQRADYQLEITKRRNLHLALKLVRGAYLVEQTKISTEKGREYPIVPNFNATTTNYLRNFEKLISQDIKGVVFAATHNESALKTLLELKEKASPSIEIRFAQLFGLGDHLTYMLKDRSERVYKLLPYAETEVMVGYLIRRAQELSQTNYPLNTQYQLLKDELYVRTISL